MFLCGRSVVAKIFSPESCTYFSDAAQVPCGCTDMMVDRIFEITSDTTGIDGDKDSEGGGD